MNLSLSLPRSSLQDLVAAAMVSPNGALRWDEAVSRCIVVVPVENCREVVLDQALANGFTVVSSNEFVAHLFGVPVSDDEDLEDFADEAFEAGLHYRWIVYDGSVPPFRLVKERPAAAAGVLVCERPDQNGEPPFGLFASVVECALRGELVEAWYYDPLVSDEPQYEGLCPSPDVALAALQEAHPECRIGTDLLSPPAVAPTRARGR